MRTKIIPIGNSRGIRIPNALLEQCGLTGEVDLTVADEGLIIKRSASPRAGWESSFREMKAAGDDRLLDETAPTIWDETEWTW